MDLRRHLVDDDPDYLVIYGLCTLWAILFAVFTPANLNLPALRLANAALMTVAGGSAVVCLYGVWTHDRLGPERLALWGVIAGFAAYALVQIPLAIVYVAAGNTDRVPLVVLAMLPVAFLNRRRRYLKHRREQVSAIAKIHEGRRR